MPRTVSVPRNRLERWLDNFAVRHGEPSYAIDADRVIMTAPDGAEARIAVPFPPLTDQAGDLRERLVRHALTDRLVGAVLVRRGGYAVGVFDGSTMIDSRNGSTYVQSRTKAGGWSQQRYARRRGNQAKLLYDKASAAIAELLLPVGDDLAAVIGGGDRAGVLAALEPTQLKSIRDLLLPRVIPTEDPRRRTLEAFGDQLLAVDIELNDQA